MIRFYSSLDRFAFQPSRRRDFNRLVLLLFFTGSQLAAPEVPPLSPIQDPPGTSFHFRDRHFIAGISISVSAFPNPGSPIFKLTRTGRPKAIQSLHPTTTVADVSASPGQPGQSGASVARLTLRRCPGPLRGRPTGRAFCGGGAFSRVSLCRWHQASILLSLGRFYVGPACYRSTVFLPC